jgi:hypothetical protein
METDAPYDAWRITSGAEPGAVKAASPVLNGEDEETGRKALRLVLTQPRCQPRLTPGVRQPNPSHLSRYYDSDRLRIPGLSGLPGIISAQQKESCER